MRILIDGLAITGDSLAIVAEHLVAGWAQLPDRDELHVVVGPGNEAPFPPSVVVHEVPFGRRAQLSRIKAQNIDLPRIARDIKPDALVGLLPTTTNARLPCPRVIVGYDLRHELRPQQFSRMNRLQRKISYNLGWRQSDGIAVISGRTKADLLASRPWLATRPLRVAWLGADHTDNWPRDPGAAPYALAFGQYFNKNVDLVIDAWAILRDRGPVMPLTIVGLGQAARTAATAKVEQLGLADLVRVMPWLSIEEFRGTFASASLIVFPSDFEGFGLPAAEGMRLGIPVVITPEPALVEITDGHATVMSGWDATALADAVVTSQAVTGAQIEAARVHAQRFTWENAAACVRAVVVDVTS